MALLHTFVRIVEAGSLSAAAETLGTSQPTVSRRLQTLERALGVRLLRRSTHGMTLTEEGSRCFDGAKDLLDGWDALESDLRGTKDEPRGRLRVVAPHAFGQEHLMVPLGAYLRRYPAVSVEWLLYDRFPDFIAEGVDCAIKVGAVEDPSVVALRLAEVPRIVVARPGLWGEGAPPPDHPDGLHRLPWLALRTFYRTEVSLTNREDEQSLHFPIRPRLSTDSLYALRNGVLAGLGAAVISAWVVADDIAQGRLVHLAPDWRAEPLPVYLAYPQARHYPAKLRRFIEIIRAAMPTLAGMRAAER